MAGAPLQTVLDHLRRLRGRADDVQRSDRDLLRAFVSHNDQDAFALVVTRHAPLVWGVCRRILGHQQDAEDAFQATFLVLARRAGSIRWRSSIGGWLHKVAQRLAVRARQRREQRCCREQAVDRPRQAESSLQDLAAAVDEELRLLPAKYREPLLLHYLQGATAQAAARQLGLSRATFYNRLARGRDMLRQRLSRQGLSLAAPLLATVLMQEAEGVAPSLIEIAQRGWTAHVPERVASLAGEALLSTTLLKMKVGLALGLLLGVAAGGVAMLTPRAPMSPTLAAERSTEAPREEEKPAVRVDRHGDRLPPGAVTRLGTLRFRVDAEIEGGLAFAPDGKTLAVRGNGGLWLLDAVSGKQLRRIDRAGALNPRLAFSPEGKRLINACQANERDPARHVIHLRRVVRVWETASGRQVIESELPDARWVGWSADGQPFAAYVAKGELRLRNVATGRQRRFLARDLPDPIRAEICTCIVGEKVVAASDEKSRIHVWDLAGGDERYSLEAGEGQPYVRSLSLSPDGRWLVSLAQNAAGTYFVRWWDVRTGKLRQAIARDQQHLAELVFAPDGKTLATVGWTEIRLWDVATWRERCRFSSPSGWFGQSVAFSPDSKTLAVAERYSGAIHRWDAASGKQKAEPEGHTNWPGPAAFSLDGKRLATGGRMDGALFVWDLATGAPLVHIQRQGTGHGYAFSADGRTLFSLWGDKLYFNDAATGRPIHVVKLEDPDRPATSLSGESLHLSDDRTRLIALSRGDNRDRGLLVTGWDLATRKRLFHRRRKQTTDGNAVSPDGRLLATAEAGAGGKGELMGAGPMRVEDLASGEPLLTFRPLPGSGGP
jgi:RNA polymerase sigma factor (sigma-70 family)